MHNIIALRFKNVMSQNVYTVMLCLQSKVLFCIRQMLHTLH